MGETSIEWGAKRHPRATNWKGGRTVASNGYVLIKLPGHHLADVRGYVYEHRLVAEQILGRPLRPGEVPHHRNGIKSDNRPENIEVVESAAEHHVHHRKHERGLQMPGESNPEIPCACGCGTLFAKFDGSGRPRRYVSGHNPQPQKVLSSVSDALAGGPLHRDAIREITGQTRQGIAVALSRLRHAGVVAPSGGGVWGLA